MSWEFWKRQLDEIPIPSLLGKEGGMTRPWRDRSIPSEERRQFLEEVGAGNLRRMFWLLIAYLPLSGWLVTQAVIDQEYGMIPWLIGDGIMGVVFLLLNLGAQRPQASWRAQDALVVVYYLYSLFVMDAFYFAALPNFGETTSYAVGVMIVTVLFRQPPRRFVPIILLNHAIFSSLIPVLTPGPRPQISLWVLGTDAVIVSLLASWFLFSKDWKDFEKKRLIARYNRDLARANAQLSRSNEEMDEVMAIAAHDLRSPLQNMRALFELLGTKADWQKEPYATAVAECERTCNGMLGLVGGLLEAHEVETRDPEIEPVPFDARAAARRAVERIKSLAEGKSVRVETELEAAELHGNAAELERILDNLLSNAVKFSPEKAVVRVSLSRGENCHVIEVADEGPGIPHEDRPSLFRKFHRGGHAETAEQQGAGLGLFIVRRLTESLGGTVTHREREGGGSIFRVEIPRH